MIRGPINYMAGASLLVLSCTLSTNAAAQEAASSTDNAAEQSGVTEITVTAQRRAQSQQDVPMAVTALQGEQLRAIGVQSSKDISKFAAGVLLDSTSGGNLNANLTVRGISQSDFSSIQESPNSTYIDDIYLSSANSAAFTLYDIQRIEVLRGPQGTLFGRASSGGLANFISNRPTKEFTGYAEAGYSTFNDKNFEMALSGPLSQSVRFRLSGRRETADGWFKNGLPGESATYEKNFYGVRGQLEADVSSSVTARLSVSYDANPRHHDGMFRTVPAYIQNGQPVLLPENVDAYGTGPGKDMTGYRNPYLQFNKGDFNSDASSLQNKRFSSSLYLTANLSDSLTLNSITNYTKFSYDYRDDCDGGPVNFCVDIYSQNLKQWSQEIRLNGNTDRLNYTAGLFYLQVDQHSPLGFALPAASGTEFAFDTTNDVYQNMKSWAVFGQGEYKITDPLSVTLGVRYTRQVTDIDSKTYFKELGSFYGGAGVNEPPLLAYDFSKQSVGNLARMRDGLWSGKFQIDYRPKKGALFYAGVSRGVKAGGFNTNSAASLSIAQTPFKSEFLYAYEAGAKLELLDRKLRVNLSGFYYDYHRFQGFAFDNLLGVVSNHPASFKGGELEIVAAPTQDLDIIFSAANLTSKVHDVGTAYSGIRDQESIMAPRWTVSGSITKRFSLPIGTLALNWNGNFIDKRFASIDNNAATFVPGSFVHNARVSLDVDSIGTQFSVFVDNISNKARQVFAYDTTSLFGTWARTYATPRVVGVSVRKSF